MMQVNTGFLVFDTQHAISPKVLSCAVQNILNVEVVCWVSGTPLPDGFYEHPDYIILSEDAKNAYFNFFTTFDALKLFSDLAHELGMDLETANPYTRFGYIMARPDGGVYRFAYIDEDEDIMIPDMTTLRPFSVSPSYSPQL